MRLTFENRKFVLQNFGGPIVTLPAAIGNENWRRSSSYSFETKSIQEAVRFRKVADSKAENIFKTLMLRDLPIPSGGLLTPKGLELFDFQRERGVPYILSRNRSYLAHSPGLGKTAQAITAVSTKPGRALIICPSFLKITWAREITKWFIRDFPSIKIVGKHVNDFDADFVICSDAMLERDWVREGLAAQTFRYVFVDEGHRFKTPNTNRTIALFGGKNKKIKSRGLIYKSEHVSILSGTPMLNRPIELWPMLFAMAPEVIDFMSYEEFGFRYCGATRNEYGWEFLGSTREDELKERLSRFMQRIHKKDVLQDLPKKIREVVVMDEEPRPKDVVAFDRKLVHLFRRKKEKALELGEYAKLRHFNGVSKVNWSARFIKDILQNDLTEQVIVFAHHRDVVEKLAKALKEFAPLVINGGVKESERTRIEDQFQSGKCRILIGNIDAMNLGLTLTAATRVIFVEYSWTPALNEQAEDRANRIGSRWSVFCQYIVLQGSIDEDILNSNLIKQERIEGVGL